MLPKKSLVFALVAGSVAFGVTAVADSRGERVVAQARRLG